MTTLTTYPSPLASAVLGVCRAIPGWMYDQELLWLHEQARQAKIIVEVGVWQGKSTIALALGTPGVVYAIDHWRGSREELETHHAEMTIMAAREAVFLAAMKHLHPFIDAGRVVPLPMESSRAAELLGPFLKERGGADLIFLDGGHDYRSVAADIYTWRPLLAAGGLLGGHDYKPDFPGVIEATRELGGVDLGPGSLWSKRL